MIALFHVKRKGFLRTFVLAFIAGAALLIFGALRGTAAFWILAGTWMLIALWWGLR